MRHYYVTYVNNENHCYNSIDIEADNKAQAIEFFESFNKEINKPATIKNSSYIVSITDITESTPLSITILEKNFLKSKYSVDDYYSSRGLIPFEIKIVINFKINPWNLLWNTKDNVLLVEDDPMIKIKTVGELEYILKLAGINKVIQL
jgi:hypothetical protein